MVSQSFEPPVIPTFFRGMTEAELCQYFQSQIPGHPQGCGPYSIAMAANVFNSRFRATDYQGGEVEKKLEHFWLKIPGFGMPTWFGVKKALKLFIQGKVDANSHSSLMDIQHALIENKLPMVAISWQSTKEIISNLKKATVGHYMVAVGFDTAKNKLFFLNPGLTQKEGISHLFSISYQEFETFWNEKSNLFITPGSIWTISI
jgi:hypothetical protein